MKKKKSFEEVRIFLKENILKNIEKKKTCENETR